MNKSNWELYMRTGIVERFVFDIVFEHQIMKMYRFPMIEPNLLHDENLYDTNPALYILYKRSYLKRYQNILHIQKNHCGSFVWEDWEWICCAECINRYPGNYYLTTTILTVIGLTFIATMKYR